ncbi:nicotinate phosphoribosyltransferase [Paenibacillus sp. J31TS4]|uniref:nicotinate phosphoribosyltransferase n=1 Tax=Paenibacillus sp. J31TS4 TaxID=2807195 RepID=UPI001B2D9067|nr:nicotinate phosphoribosyltransferase [Paenibacillus sp. J31TS4]GIP41435.1 nicotinate phosphoribosyltransferase [Paenibacillus sp. J31TS4]
MDCENLALHTDKYQINMMYAHWRNGTHNRKAVFDAFFRKLPFGNGFAVFAGLERIVNYLNALRFDEQSIAYLAEQEENYDPAFYDELRAFRFTGNLFSVREGQLVFPNEPLIRVEARVFEAQLIETALLNFMNFQTLLATKAARIKQVASTETLLEFGTRRAQEADAAIWGARSAYIAGFHGTSNMRAGMMFGIPTKGTHAHAWVQDHATEEEAFRRFADALPDESVLLVDTYDTLRSGVPNAIKTACYLQEKGKRLKGIRLDSGDLAYLSIQARKMLDEAGLTDATITASNDLDENTILDLKAQGARIDVYGVGTQLITAGDQPSLGGVYKLVAREDDEGYVPAIKISGNPEKITNPGIKNIYRILNKKTGKAEGDYITLADEQLDETRPLKLFNPTHTFIQKRVKDYHAVPILEPIYVEGKQVYQLPTLEEIRHYHEEQLQQFWPEYLRKLNPEEYPVDLSEALWELKMQLIREHLDASGDSDGKE